jgi:hypothetical protein
MINLLLHPSLPLFLNLPSRPLPTLLGPLLRLSSRIRTALSARRTLRYSYGSVSKTPLYYTAFTI